MYNIQYLLLKLILFTAISCIVVNSRQPHYYNNIEALKPCFERVIGQSLIDTQPYHSEWRMTESDQCLLFCALSSSRCRVIVYDRYQHICHYYSGHKSQNVILSRKSIYFKVSDKQCLDDVTHSPQFILPSTDRSNDDDDSNDNDDTEYSESINTADNNDYETTTESSRNDKNETDMKSKEYKSEEVVAHIDNKLVRTTLSINYATIKPNSYSTTKSPQSDEHELKQEMERGKSDEDKDIFLTSSESDNQQQRQQQRNTSPDSLKIIHSFNLVDNLNVNNRYRNKNADKYNNKDDFDHNNKHNNRDYDNNDNNKQSLKSASKMKLRESANDKSTLFKVNKSPYHMIREANIPDSTRNAHSSSHSNEDTSDLNSNREQTGLSDSSSHSNEQKVGKFNMKLSATKQKVNRFDADKNDDDSDKNVVTDSSDYDKISSILGAAMLPPMEVHKPAKIYSSKAIKNSFTVDNNVRRSPSKTTHNPPDSKVGSEKWSVPKESEDSAKRVESFFSDDNDNDNNYNYYNNRNDDQNNNNNNENAPEIMLLNENGEYIRSFESKPDLATRNYHSKMEQDESKGKSYESDEPKIESSLDDLSIPLPSMQVVSMKLTKHADENVNNDNIPSAACGKNDVDVWISIENAIFNSMSAQKLSYAHSAHACKQKCNTITNAGRECPAVTYHEMEHECIAYTNNIQSILALRIKPSSTNNFNTRTLLKFCYPVDLQAFNGCSEFTSFPDYTLDVKPREQFDGMPTGYEGLKACIELCVLSPNFYCKSASFRYTEGRCLLRDDNSMTKPEAFHEHSPLNDEIYFENGCEQILTIDNQQDSSEHAQMVRVSSTEGDYSK